MKKLKLILADDHEMILDGIRALLEGEDHIQIIDQVHDGVELLNRLQFSPKPDLVIVDINMPNKDGIEVTTDIKSLYPQIKVLILSMHHRKEFVNKLLEAGADGYILKNSGRVELLKAIDQISKGSGYFSTEIMKANFEAQYYSKPFPTVELSQREKDVVRLIANGNSSQEIAEELCISTHTVDSHRKHILSKINAKNSVDITHYAFKTGIIKGFDIL